MKKLTYTLAGLTVVAGMVAPVASAAGDVITYEVTSNGSLSTVTYFDGMDEEQQEMDQPSSWSKTFDSEATYQSVVVSAQTEGTRASCQITKNGEVVDQQTAVGRYTVVMCSAA